KIFLNQLYRVLFAFSPGLLKIRWSICNATINFQRGSQRRCFDSHVFRIRKGHRDFRCPSGNRNLLSERAVVEPDPLDQRIGGISGSLFPHGIVKTEETVMFFTIDHEKPYGPERWIRSATQNLNL